MPMPIEDAHLGAIDDQNGFNLDRLKRENEPELAQNTTNESLRTKDHRGMQCPRLACSGASPAYSDARGRECS